ncbi:MAG: dihydropteroate synthase [Bowdeniella nasicola]|nr:dihydropteroate synthase [Bowdeniella nasicola]
MGIVNVTPDSFSDGGEHAETQAAVRHGVDLARAGATVLDVGGESTRPGSTRVDPNTEWERIGEVVASLVGAGFTVSVDTLHAQTAERALAAGAAHINDVSGGLYDPNLPAVLARYPEAGYLIGHWRGTPETMNQLATYEDPVAEVCAELSERIEAARSAGVSAAQIVVDPGLGFAKDRDHNWAILAGLDRVARLGYPVMLGASRKRFLAPYALDHSAGAAGRDLATAVLSGLAAQRYPGLWALRVHDVASSRIALELAEKMSPDV